MSDRSSDPMVAFSEFLETTSREVDDLMERLMPPAKVMPKVIHRAMRYSLFAGGKRIRPALVVLGYRAAGGKGRVAHSAGAAIELIHTFSLIHDDLPCMDDDDYRRGKLSNHKVFGEGVAVLAGDALHALGFDVLARLRRFSGTTPEAVLDVMDEVGRAIGTDGMIGGQVMDLEWEGAKPTRQKVEYIHRRKTAALLRSSLVVGGMLAGADKRTLRSLNRYGEPFGLAFQIVDDILNVRRAGTTLGKKPGGDERLGKITWPAAHGLPSSQRDVTRLLDEAAREAPAFGKWVDHFLGLADYISIRRQAGRA
ncbi:MAG: farnesyl diphosphate synthase [Candidatus Eisenbacteria bacterium]|nr:farnesyl diphosphate synthase [Candidatus Eisenbacteria bacterium]